MKTAAFITLGCKINQYETEAIREEVLALGYREVPPSEPAEVFVVNTCAVTAESGANSRKAVERAARANPGARILVVGCSTPSERERLAAIPQVALLAGNEEKAMVASFLDGGWKPGEPFPGGKGVLDLSISRYADRTRANVKVQDGCDSFCSFCIIPFLRGRSRSRSLEAIIGELERLAANGYREVVLTGVHLQDYGRDLDSPATLAGLLGQVAGVRGIERVRLSSLGARAFTPEVLDVLEDPVFCPHWHIPLQSGSDRVLRIMRRDYTLAEFRGVVEALRQRFDEPSIATDVIAGHPGETPADFEATLAFSRQASFSKIHVFPYSLREGTLASKLGGHVDPMEVRQRARVLRDLDQELSRAHAERFLGRVLDDVLVEGGLHVCPEPAGAPGPAPARVGLEGHTARHLRVRFPAPSPRALERFRGTLQPVRADRAGPGLVHGEWVGALVGEVAG